MSSGFLFDYFDSTRVRKSRFVLQYRIASTPLVGAVWRGLSSFTRLQEQWQNGEMILLK